jgi:signal transduction histidine kinase
MRAEISDWDYAKGISREDADQYLRKAISEYVTPVFEKYKLQNSYCAVTGLSIAKFEPILEVGVNARQLEDSLALISDWVRTCSEVPTEIQKVGDALFLPIVGLGELFGFAAVLDFPHALVWHALKRDWKDATVAIADFNYARRVIALAVPLGNYSEANGEMEEAEFLRQVARTTALSFGADAAIIRLYDTDEQVLKVAAWEGDVTDQVVADLRPGEALAGVVLSSLTSNWALAEIGPKPIVRGAELPKASVEFLRDLGIRASLCARMDEPLVSASKPVGTITYYFRRANRFSWRDVALFVGFARRVTDLLGLIRQANRLQEKTRILEIQAPVFTQAELAHLLVHDLSHKVLDIEGEAADLQDEVRKEVRRYREKVSPELLDRFQAFQHSIEVLKKEVIDLRAVGRLQDKNDEILQPTRFNAATHVSSVVQLMKSVLDRQKITPIVNETGNTTLFGPVKVFEHVLLNFIINTIDAAKARTTQRPMTMHFALAGDASGVRIKIWDTGPGVDMSKFKSAEEVFKIGKTTKAGGTGMGLPVARALLELYYKGSIQLVNPRSALFEISFVRTSES